MIAGYSYDVFGAIRSQTGSSCNYWLFTGEQRDSDSSFYYLRARYYDPAIGRFLAQDPLPVLVCSPDTTNRYTYVLNNPVNFVDRTGLASEGPSQRAGIGHFWSMLGGLPVPE